MISAPNDIWGINAFRILVQQITEPRALALLGVSKALLRRYLTGTSKVPRMAVLALYWESPYGRGMIDADHVTEIGYLHRQIWTLQRENARSRARVAHLLRIGEFGCANDAQAV